MSASPRTVTLNTNMVVMTHQGFRDDMLRCLQGVAPQGVTSTDGKLRDWFMGLPRKERAAVLAQAWKVNGINYQRPGLESRRGDRQLRGLNTLPLHLAPSGRQS